MIIGRLIPAGTGFKQFYLYEYTKKNCEENIISLDPYNFEDNIIYKILTNQLEQNKRLN